jgi:hypothetical protein
VTKRRIRDDRLFGALCHAGIFLGLWGLITTAAIWAFRRDRSRIIRFQGAQALVYQLLVLAVVFAGAAGCVLWMQFGQNDAYDADAAREALGLWSSSGVLSGLILTNQTPSPFTWLSILHAFFGFGAFLVLLLCLLGLEPSYPFAGLLTRRILGLRIERPAASKDKETETDEEGGDDAEAPAPETASENATRRSS